MCSASNIAATSDPDTILASARAGVTSPAPSSASATLASSTAAWAEGTRRPSSSMPVRQDRARSSNCAVRDGAAGAKAADLATSLPPSSPPRRPASVRPPERSVGAGSNASTCTPSPSSRAIGRSAKPRAPIEASATTVPDQGVPDIAATPRVAASSSVPRPSVSASQRPFASSTGQRVACARSSNEVGAWRAGRRTTGSAAGAGEPRLPPRRARR